MFLCIPREILPPVFKKIKQKEDSREIKEENMYNSPELMPLHSTKAKKIYKKSLEPRTLESTEITKDT